MSSPTWSSILGRLDGGLDLDSDSARWAVEQIMSGQADPEDVKAFLEEIERLENELPPDLREQQLNLIPADEPAKGKRQP